MVDFEANKNLFCIILIFPMNKNLNKPKTKPIDYQVFAYLQPI